MVCKSVIPFKTVSDSGPILDLFIKNCLEKVRIYMQKYGFCQKKKQHKYFWTYLFYEA